MTLTRPYHVGPPSRSTKAAQHTLLLHANIMTTAVKHVSTNEFTWAVIEDEIANASTNNKLCSQPHRPHAWQAQEASRPFSPKLYDAVIDQAGMHEWYKQVQDLSNGPCADADDKERAIRFAQWRATERKSTKESKPLACSDWEIV